MANVFLTDVAKARLKAVKEENESYSDIIMQYVPQKINWNEFVGSCKGIDAEKIKSEIREERHR